MLRGAVRRLPGIAPLVSGARRGVLPLPALAAAAVKFGGAAMLKKVALSKVIQKVGPQRTVTELRKLNERLRSSGGRYSSKVADAADESLNALDGALDTLRGDERLGAVWAWYATLEKNNPTLAAAILKTWLETLPGMRWASALMSGSPSSSSNAQKLDNAEGGGGGGGGGGAGGGGGIGSVDSASVASDEHAATLIQAIRESHPQIFEAYHVVLVPRDDGREQKS